MSLWYLQPDDTSIKSEDLIKTKVPIPTPKPKPKVPKEEYIPEKKEGAHPPPRRLPKIEHPPTLPDLLYKEKMEEEMKLQEKKKAERKKYKEKVTFTEWPLTLPILLSNEVFCDFNNVTQRIKTRSAS